MQAKLFYSRFSASTLTQVYCPYAYICEAVTENKPTSPPVIEIPKLFMDGGADGGMDDGVDGGMDGGVDGGVGATVELLFDKYCSPSAVESIPCLKRVGLEMSEHETSVDDAARRLHFGDRQGAGESTSFPSCLVAAVQSLGP